MSRAGGTRVIFRNWQRALNQCRPGKKYWTGSVALIPVNRTISSARSMTFRKKFACKRLLERKGRWLAAFWEGGWPAARIIAISGGSAIPRRAIGRLVASKTTNAVIITTPNGLILWVNDRVLQDDGIHVGGGGVGSGRGGCCRDRRPIRRWWRRCITNGLRTARGVQGGRSSIIQS